MGRNPVADRFILVMTVLISLPGIVLMILGFLLLIPAVLSQVITLPLQGVWQILSPFCFSLGAFLVYFPRYIDWLAKRMDVTEPAYSNKNRQDVQDITEENNDGNNEYETDDKEKEYETE